MFGRLTLSGTVIAFAVGAGSGIAHCKDGSANLKVGDPAARIIGPHKESGPVDETALRYYASLKQTKRVEAETRRLQRLYPNWQPPGDLWTSRSGSADEGPLWELFATDRLDELHKAIKARQASDPNWAPSTDLAQKLLRKELRANILAGKDNGDWAYAARAADQGDFEHETGDVELLWVISDAYARTKRPADAFRILTSILNARSDPKERAATIQRSIASLPMADTERLIALAKTGTSGGDELAEIGIDITRARITAFLHDQPTSNPSAIELDRFKDYARTSTDPSQPGIVAWYALKRNDLREALEWFKSAIAQGGDATIAHGLAHTLKRLGQLREAEEIAYAWREPSPANSILFIDILADQLTHTTPMPIEAKRLARYAEVTLQTGSGEGAQALAWFAYNSCQYDVAVEWFRRSVAWFPKETSVFGYALTLRRLKRQHDFIEVVNRYDGLFPKVLELLFPEGKRRQVNPCDAPSTEKVARAAEKSSEFLDLRPVQPGQSVVLARGDGQRLLATPAASSRPARAIVPSPLDVSNDISEEIPLVRRADFPVAVSPENPLRFASTGLETPRAGADTKWRDSDVFGKITVARRVPGVGSMPYERYGLTLQRGWNGSDQPSYSIAVDSQAPLGTLWHTEQASLSLAATIPANTAIDGARLSASPSAVSAADPTIPSRFHP